MMHRPARASLLILLAALAVSGCGGIGPGRTPSGTTATSRIDAAGVTRLDVAYGFDVRVRLGQPEAVTITYDDNLADLLDVRVDGRTLRIQLQPNSNLDHRPTLRAEVTMARLEELRAAGASTVTVASKLPGANLRLLVSGSSRVAATDLAVDRAEATVSGSSRLELTGTANALSARGSGASRGSVNVTGTIAAQVSGASKLTYAGTPQFTKRDTSGGSSIQAA
jgi:Putative auto-transporter adhesin, head GIN domain